MADLRTPDDLLPLIAPGAQVEVRDTLPMSAVGKILYRVLRDEHVSHAEAGRMEPRPAKADAEPGSTIGRHKG